MLLIRDDSTGGTRASMSTVSFSVAAITLKLFCATLKLVEIHFGSLWATEATLWGHFGVTLGVNSDAVR